KQARASGRTAMSALVTSDAEGRSATVASDDGFASGAGERSTVGVVNRPPLARLIASPRGPGIGGGASAIGAAAGAATGAATGAAAGAATGAAVEERCVARTA